ncbi:MAG TPA: hypothetical protein VFH03_27155 [Actinoplanes sp.]|nr:hypothetical protein [Actinoplanes sp.]
MRRLVVSVGVTLGLVLIGAGPAFAEPVPEAGATQEAAPGKKVCKVTDDRLDELSGIVATDDGFIVINDSTQQSSRKRVFFLNDKCKVVDDVPFSGNGPRDTEDLLLSADGKTLWIADIGDNRRERGTIGLWTMPSDGSKRPKIHRLAYPDGPHDAEALLLTADDVPIIVTKEVSRPAALYQPTAALKTENTEGVPMKKVGEVTVPPSNTPSNTLARLGRGTIDGGAVSSGGGKVVLRTYTDALEWTVSGGDVVAALKGEPRVTPLPQEPLGEAITYSPDGRYFYTVSDMQGDTETDNYILQYTPVSAASTTKAADGTGGGGEGGGASWFDNLSINDITYLMGGVGVIGAILVGLGIFGIMRARKRPPGQAVVNGGPAGPKPTDAETELLAVGGAKAGAGVYGSGSGAYGGKPAPHKGGVYGGSRPSPGSGRPPPGGGPSQGGGPLQGGGPSQAGGRASQGRPVPGAARPGAGGRPGVNGQPIPGRPGVNGQPMPGRPGPGGQPVARPAPGGRSSGGQPGGRSSGGQPGGAPRGGGYSGGRSGGGGESGGRSGDGQPGGLPGGGGHSGGRSGGGGQPMGRPGSGGGRSDGGVYGAPPANPPGASRGGNAGGPGQRSSGWFGPDNGRPVPSDSADSRDRDYDYRGYGR